MRASLVGARGKSGSGWNVSGCAGKEATAHSAAWTQLSAAESVLRTRSFTASSAARARASLSIAFSADAAAMLRRLFASASCAAFSLSSVVASASAACFCLIDASSCSESAVWDRSCASAAACTGGKRPGGWEAGVLSPGGFGRCGRAGATRRGCLLRRRVPHRAGLRRRHGGGRLLQLRLDLGVGVGDGGGLGIGELLLGGGEGLLELLLGLLQLGLDLCAGWREGARGHLTRAGGRPAAASVARRARGCAAGARLRAGPAVKSMRASKRAARGEERWFHQRHPSEGGEGARERGAPSQRPSWRTPGPQPRPS